MREASDLPQTPPEPISGVTPSRGPDLSTQALASDTAKKSPLTQALTTVGHYTLVEEIAHGGMGVIYRATDPTLGRDVAVKLIQRPYADEPAAIRRFREEAKITGQLQHPGIPPVHELGTLPDGGPYLVMKLIKGQTLHALLAGERRSVSSTSTPNLANFIAIFEQVCQALAYAHNRGIIHRDLKPQNIMVGAFGEVQVMDWGLAKLVSRDAQGSADSERQTATDPPATTFVDPRAASDSDKTQPGSILGTPSYMSPEQAAGMVEEVDRRADVFGLGAILCCILTGEPPYSGGSVEQLRTKAVRGELAPIFAKLDASGAEPTLIALCRRCLAAKKENRPADAGEVAAAVAGIRAQAEERARQAEKERGEALVRADEQYKRRQVWLGLAAALLVGLLASSALAVWAYLAQLQASDHERQALKERDDKEAARRAEADARQAEALARAAAQVNERKANENDATSRAVIDFVQEHIFAAARPKGYPGAQGADVKLSDALQAALSSMEKKFSQQPLVEARLRMTLGITFLELGKAAIAEKQFLRARALYAQELGQYHHDTLGCASNVARSIYLQGRFSEALALQEDTLALMKKWLKPNDRNLLRCMNNLGETYQSLGRHTEALKQSQETLALMKVIMGANHPETLVSMNNVASAYFALGLYEEAQKAHEETLELRRAHLGPEHPETVGSLNNLAGVYMALGRRADARKLYEEALTLQKNILGPDHLNTLATMHNLAVANSSLGRVAEALKIEEEGLARSRVALGPNHPDTLQKMNGVVVYYTNLGRHTEAQATARELIQLLESGSASPQSGGGQVAVTLAGAYCNLGDSLSASGKPEEALPCLGKAQACLEALLARQKNAEARQFLRNVHWCRAKALEQLGRPADADADWVKALELSPSYERSGMQVERTKWKAKRKPASAP